MHQSIVAWSPGRAQPNLELFKCCKREKLYCLTSSSMVLQGPVTRLVGPSYSYRTISTVTKLVT